MTAILVSYYTTDEDEEEEKDQANEDEEDGVGSRHHYHYQTGLRMSPIVGSSHTTQTNLLLVYISHNNNNNITMLHHQLLELMIIRFGPPGMELAYLRGNAQLNTGVQDRKGKFIFNNNNNNKNNATPNDEMLLSNPCTRFLGNKVYSSIQHPRRNLTLTSSRKETSNNNNNKSSDHTYNNNDDDPRKIIEDGLLQMMDIDICDNNLSVLHPMAIDRIVHTLDTRVHLLHNIIQELLRFSGGKETAVAALVGYRKGRLLIQRLCTALQYVLLPPHDDDAQCSCSSSDAGNDVLNNDNTNSHHHDHHHHGVGDSMMIMRGRGRTLSLLQNKDEVTHRQEHRIQTLLSTIEDTIRWEHLTYPCYNMLTILSSMLHCITRQENVRIL
ncbi:hypothetical protein Pmar_PMAR005925 [Perkinsus marinus ATCC 50983]|uniref:Uncharacterized protein n=1 Tax=Perkinsus marinus (strain ATCC 50983 / TXsc) TaxID=423536 RepID=C5LL21_PERM5|nr:hypothetical protein Pmar_PMAR005925 [Perkinsus marinus ATCC 50983]EER02585.1 hypothetical protein Pmar_PMAR005925 [Perkinsus marinus ATCC 50983]|eukprot:XP_002769867.1 hypothetical protein Pmar_PMAR005925 [Perkinsus marinus ATCC 50983]